MRRIFGATNITGSSTSNSLSSDALPSPTGESNYPSYEQQQQQQPYSFQLSPISSDQEVKKGGSWFNTSSFATFGDTNNNGNGNGNGNGVPTASSSRTAAAGLASPYSGGRPSNESSSTSYSSAMAGQLDEFEDLKLPFGGRSASGPTSPRSPPKSHQHHQRNGSNASSLQNSYGPTTITTSRPFSPFSSTSASGQTSTADVKDQIMIDLLCGQAVVETKDYQILDWDEVQEIKKEHTILASRIASLSRSLALETRLRDSAAKLVRLSSPTNNSATSPTLNSSLPNSPNQPRVTKTQAEIQLSNANAKIETIQADLYKVGWKESELRTKLMRHTAGVLGLALRRKEEEERGSAPTPLSVSAMISVHGSVNGSAAPRDRQRSVSPSLAPQQRFDGHSFFAGNKEAIVPGHNSRLSPFGSPNLSASNGQFGSAFAPVDPSSQAAIRDLEIQVAELQSALAASRDRIDPVEHQTLRQELEHARNNERSIRDEHDSTSREAADLKRELERHMTELRSVRDGHETTRRELDQLRTSNSSAAQTQVEEARREAEDAAQKLREMEIELNELEHRAVESDRRVADVEDRLEETKDKHAHELQRVHADLSAAREEAQRHTAMPSRSITPAGNPEEEQHLRDEIDALRKQRYQVSRSVGELLSRHRSRSTALGQLPEYDQDAVDHHDDWPSYIASTLDSHLDTVASHASSLDNEVNSNRAVHEESTRGLRDELQEAINHRDHWQNEAEQHRQTKEQLEAEHEGLRRTLQGQEERIASLAPLEQQIAGSSAESERIRQEFATAQEKVQSLEAQVAELTSAQHKSNKALQDLWKSMPALESRQQASNSDDLATLKSAFESPRRGPMGLIADIGNSSKFSIESLIERVKILLAEDSKLVQKLMSFETDVGSVRKELETHRTEAERATNLAKQHSTNLTLAQKQIKELEERIEVSSNQEVTMLERLNDLTESLESTRADKRKLEASCKTITAQVESVEAEKSTLLAKFQKLEGEHEKLASRPDHSSRLAQLENSVQDLKDTLADTEEELEDAKKREQRTRAQLLDELSSTQAEVSSLKTKLRQAERKASGRPAV